MSSDKKGRVDKRINLRIQSIDTYEWLKQEALKQSITLTELINRVLNSYRSECESLNEPRQY